MGDSLVITSAVGGPMSTSLLRVGSFVQAAGELAELGVGKITDRSGGHATVEYFYSVARRSFETIPLSELVPVPKVASQTRCFVPRVDGPWRMGRIGRLVDGQYEVFFRQGHVEFLPPSSFFVRCASPNEDPIETLAYKGHDTPYFHDRRFRFVRSLVRQRAAACGMTGLLSSRIRLFHHQVEVTRRVLEDPVQRYLLADEVGLGKTIEAGIVLRQFLLDEPRGRAVVLVPPLLVDQWTEELESKFLLSRLGEDRFDVISTEDIGNGIPLARAGLAIVDEAQNVASWAFSADPVATRRYREFERLCRAVPSVLLLSATPVLNNERDFLAMLHLLDPGLHRLDDLEAFRDRVRIRQEVGHVLLSLQEGSPSYVIQPSLERLRELFPADTRVAQLACDLDSVLRSGLPGEEQDRVIRALRVHVSETYRLHRRMLRNRRAAVTADAILGRSSANGSQTPRILETDIDERSPRLYRILEDWREAASFAAQEANRAESVTLRESDFVEIFSILLQAAGTWLGLLEEVVRCRLGRFDLDALSTEFLPGALKSLDEAPYFEGELEILETMLDVLREPSEEGDRLALLEASLDNARRSGRGGIPAKCVVFTSYTRSCNELLRHLREAFGEKAVAGYHRGLTRTDVEREISRFRLHAECFILVCDRCGEEGRNLQYAERVVHFDLPFSPNRMEQRIGRLDRIGRTRPVRSTIFIRPEQDGTLFAAWYSVLNDGFRVFDRSIASLQFYVDESLPELLLTMFREGADGVLARIPAVQQGCAAEEERIAEQDALDTIDALETGSAACFEAIGELEDAHAELEDDLHSWVGEALGFNRDHDFRRVEGTTLYKVNFDRRYNELRTLVPIDWLQRRFLPHLDRPAAFDREVALRNEGTPLFRIGDGFVDAMAEYIRWDDRGQAFALWRHEPGFDPREGAEWIGFRFNYIVSADLKEAGQLLLEDRLPESAVRSLERRTDALFQPLAEVVFLDTDLNPVTDENLLCVLERPYRAHDRRGCDYNLANERLAVLDQLVPSTRWINLCGRARTASATEIMGRGTPPLRERCAARAREAERALGARVEQMRLRVGYERSGERPALARELLREELISTALVRGIETPSLRLDSVGFIVVSGRSPLGGLQEDDG